MKRNSIAARKKPHQTARGVVARCGEVEALEKTRSKKRIAAIGRYLSDRSPRVRSFAVDVIRRQQLHELSESVKRLLSDKNSGVRYSAAECLGILHEGECIRAEWLYPLLQDSSFLVRIEALESLAQIEDADAVPLIAEKLQDEHPLVRSYAAATLSELGGIKYAASIEHALATEQEENARVGYIGALVYLGREDKFPMLLEFLRSDRYHSRCAAANKLNVAPLNPSQLQTALNAIEHAQRNSIARAACCKRSPKEDEAELKRITCRHPIDTSLYIRTAEP